MRILRRFAARLGNSVIPRREDQRLKEEIEEHIALETAEHIRAGLPPAEARRQALLKFGGVATTKEDYQAERRILLLDALLQDLRYAFRMLRKSPGFTFVAVLTLALGIGANLAIFSVVNTVLLRPLPYAQPNELVDLYLKTKLLNQSAVPYAFFLFWQHESRTVEPMAAWTDDSFDLTGMGQAEHLSGRRVSASFFSVFRVQPILGRDFSPQDDRLGAARTVLISEGLWKSKFDASPNVLGKFLTLNGNRYAVIGVVPTTFRLWWPTDVYVPVGQSEDPAFNPAHPGVLLQITGRLRPGLRLPQAQAEMDVIARKLAAAHPKSAWPGSSISVYSLKQDVVGDLQATLLLLFGGVGLVLLIACSNVANLLLARSVGRAHEFAIRAALGAGRGRTIRQSVTENILLAGIGGALGVLLAVWGTHLARPLLSTVLPATLRVRIDGHVLVFALAVSVLTGVLFGLLPALKIPQSNLQETLKGTAPWAAHRPLVQTICSVVEISLAMVLLIAAGLMVRTMQQIWRTSPGFDPRNVMSFTVDFPPPGKIDPQMIRARDRNLMERLTALPGVKAASMCQGALPLSGETFTAYRRADQSPSAKPGEQNFAEFTAVGPDYFRVMGIPVVRGRAFSKSDTRSAAMVIIVDENLARRAFGREDPIGKRLNVSMSGAAEIVGVARHVKQFGLAEDAQAKIQDQIYLPFDQLPDLLAPLMAAQANIVLKTVVPPAGVVSAIRDAASKMDSAEVVYNVELMEKVLAESESERHFSASLLGGFACLALLLASIGIYGVISYSVARRTHEIGVRMTLGAQNRHILRTVVGGGLMVAGVGIVTGMVAALALTRLLASLLYGVTPIDPLTFVSVTILLTLVALVASYVPARRAMCVDPLIALRNE
jgi:predicted permease